MANIQSIRKQLAAAFGSTARLEKIEDPRRMGGQAEYWLTIDVAETRHDYCLQVTLYGAANYVRDMATAKATGQTNYEIARVFGFRRNAPLARASA